ncbi:hypothetical protein BBJ28_00007137 [Nothophytophthora sp. Chile5]|nr:hypothetical protein BBJ28_00007137 [Nothophytophthora sp. Chile5]
MFDCKTIHVLVVAPAPTRGKRTHVDEWFPREVQTHTWGVDQDDQPKVANYFEMAGFPPLLQPMPQHRKILERYCYMEISFSLMEKTKQCLGKCSANLVVTGNPGIGKSLCYLYCAFRFARGLEENQPELTLVLNCGDEYHQYCFKEQTFWKLTPEEVALLQRNPRVLRLIDGESSRLVDWQGVSVLFGLPDVKDRNRFTKGRSWTYIMPMWDSDELLKWNSLLESDLRLPEDEVEKHSCLFGGIPQAIFCVERSEMEKETARAIESWDAVKATRFMEAKQPVQESDWSHRVFQMILDDPGTFATSFHVDFLCFNISLSIVKKCDALTRLAFGLRPRPLY